MRILGADLRDLGTAGGEATVALWDEPSATVHAPDLPSVAREVARLAAGEPFVLAVDVPVAGASAEGKARRVDGWVQRRLGVRLPARAGEGANGTQLLAALATAGHPCLPYPDRDRRQAGLAEIHPELVLKSLVWERSIAASARELPQREAILRALEIPAYRGARVARASDDERFAALDLAITIAVAAGVDPRAAREELTRGAVARAASIFDATLLVHAAERYLDEPERTAFVGARETGYTILPADAFLRRVALKETPRTPERSRLFPRASLEERLADHATVRPLELLDMGGRAQRVEAVFDEVPRYEFDNLDEMLWWKHCRHLAGPDLPVDGLDEMVVRLESDDAPLRLVRSRHKTLSFRFEPPQSWRARISPRDGKTYAFRVLRAVFEAGRI
ncbi:MAG TPA: hypothetical protein VFV19_01055 [Candidatus Polarisedimenticolaceae bacterium]|nr:hypothetical protein [Candidatus Polarisedimenticolaceae bacterium]